MVTTINKSDQYYSLVLSYCYPSTQQPIYASKNYSNKMTVMYIMNFCFLSEHPFSLRFTLKIYASASLKTGRDVNWEPTSLVNMHSMEVFWYRKLRSVTQLRVIGVYLKSLRYWLIAFYLLLQYIFFILIM